MGFKNMDVFALRDGVVAESRNFATSSIAILLGPASRLQGAP
jgi:hypothetical protein